MTLSDTIRPTAQGKVRDLYDLGDHLLIVASDRISAFDYVLPSTIPFKGQVLTSLSLFWFELLAPITPNHLLSTHPADLPSHLAPFADELAGRFMLVKKAQMFPVECIVRGYLSGSGLKEYKKMGKVCGIDLPPGLVEASRLDHAVYTPSTKAELGGHDENVSFEQTVEALGAKDADLLRTKALAIYETAHTYAAQRGIIIADTKFEFGRLADGQVVLADEVLTSDSSRFWPLDAYEPGRSQASFDKQFVRDWLTANWDMQGTPPPLPRGIVEATSERYIQAYEMITGRRFEPMS
ncbi:MAG: phosphoribosylaminoimidazolesuccinocarboxamide synthase [Coriobacteriales bacterium]|jgi:phosphoribosylaminoimidazole-succinocarboxamide synthase|nr:phosphoribosylaminoimidazolesuccinocarboxamide synthase [Coriobacteriales bacterium]